MNQKETFKDISGFEGLYQISNQGTVKSLWFNKEKILKAGIDSYGYCVVYLYKNNKRHVKKVHQLLAMAFLNHKPDGHRIVVDHKNNIKTDNRIENLQIITHRENLSKDKKNKSSQYTGVNWAKYANKWRSQIRINGKIKHLGYFTDEYEAHIAYQTELKNIILCK
jgi:hypothetical protein